MEPRIQYAQTSDGVSIAFWTLGHGKPFVLTPSGLFANIQLEWQIPEARRWYERLAAKRTVIGYDSRGSGLSDRAVSDYSLNAHVLDLEAVTERRGFDRFDLFGYYHTGLAAIAYAVRHPERIEHLILWQCYESASDWSAQVEAIRALIDTDWQLYTETLAHIWLGWEGTPARQAARMLREAITPDGAQAFFRGARKFDVTAIVPQICAPTLVLHRRQWSRLPPEVAKRLAARIPGARLSFVDGTAGAPYVGDTDAVLRTMEEFVDGESEPAPGVLSAGGVSTILFTDIVSHTEMMQRLGDAKGRAVLREHERITRETLKQYAGTEVKTDGDSFMASFASVSSAVECAVTLQRAFAEYSATADEPIVIRIGLNVGEPIEEDGDYFGSAVILGARIKDQAGGGEILVPEAVRHLLAGKDFLFADRGEIALRGFEDPVRLYEVRWRDEGP